ncbi:MAG: hypothetical protein COV52_05165 [Gammaproteobacteria bacterium CG11_big_fil_rev_8_21_14_0_20_46_22]|nr:MAG: hypothetical protein COW05_10090 [Gammaproteobacteria bacterium CG12_big_fil_rev_8_21_14_0_65_46_12]PIR11186.1 MAG: hypothetical protein COV52_05165 [Gammaproteobacteria bacterium CG11_big_fil_rev_8_21_14_0_20_46_22]
MTIGQADTPHVVSPNYSQWGQKGTLSTQASSEFRDDKVRRQLSQAGIELSRFKLTNRARVQYYKGERLGETPAILLRYEESGESNKLGGKHISVVYDPTAEKILGLTVMQPNKALKQISHQKALAVALRFLQCTADDLTDGDIELPDLIMLDSDVRMKFEPKVILSKHLRLDWIARHDETISCDDETVTVSGMKVKTFNPKTELWTWIIVDDTGVVQTFERDISWNMEKMMRETQMWLHDKWLEIHEINLSDAASPDASRSNAPTP